MKELTGGRFREFSESRSEACPHQSQGSLGDEFFEVHSANAPIDLKFS